MGMDYKSPQEYAAERAAFYRGFGVECLWILALCTFITVCIMCGN